MGHNKEILFIDTADIAKDNAPDSRLGGGRLSQPRERRNLAMKHMLQCAMGLAMGLALLLTPAALMAQGKAEICGMDLRLTAAGVISIQVSLDPLALVNGREEVQRKGVLYDARGAGEYMDLSTNAQEADSGRLLVSGTALFRKAVDYDLVLTVLNGPLKPNKSIRVFVTGIGGKLKGLWSFEQGPLVVGAVGAETDCFTGLIPEK